MARQRDLLRVEEPAEVFADLIRTAAAAGHRTGWLELRQPPAVESLDAAADSGVLRAVAVDQDRTVAVKRRRGAPVLADLLRENFAGCRLVLIQGSSDGMFRGEPLENVPVLRSAEGALWALQSFSPEKQVRILTAAEFAALLEKPDPWI